MPLDVPTGKEINISNPRNSPPISTWKIHNAVNQSLEDFFGKSDPPPSPATKRTRSFRLSNGNKSEKNSKRNLKKNEPSIDDIEQLLLLPEFSCPNQPPDPSVEQLTTINFVISKSQIA